MSVHACKRWIRRAGFNLQMYGFPAQILCLASHSGCKMRSARALCSPSSQVTPGYSGCFSPAFGMTRSPKPIPTISPVSESTHFTVSTLDISHQSSFSNEDVAGLTLIVARLPPFEGESCMALAEFRGDSRREQDLRHDLAHFIAPEGIEVDVIDPLNLWNQSR